LAAAWFFAAAFFAVCPRPPHPEPTSRDSFIGIPYRQAISGPRTEAQRPGMVRGGSAAFGLFAHRRSSPACLRRPLASATFGAQPRHHRRLFPSDSSP
jgi:hypothetical protein